MKKIGNIFQKKFQENPRKKSFFGHARRSAPQEGDVFDFLDMIEAWPKIIGPTLSKVTTPLKIQQKSLYLISAHPAFSQQLSSMEQEIIKKVTSYFPNLTRKVTKIYFQTNPSHFKKKQNTNADNIENYEKKNKFNKFSPRYRKLKSEALQIFTAVEDESARNSLVNIYIQTKIDEIK